MLTADHQIGREKRPDNSINVVPIIAVNEFRYICLASFLVCTVVVAPLHSKHHTLADSPYIHASWYRYDFDLFGQELSQNTCFSSPMGSGRHAHVSDVSWTH